MKDAKIYLRAAREIHRYNDYSCIVIDHACEGFNTEARLNYERLFRPEGSTEFAWVHEALGLLDERGCWRTSIDRKEAEKELREWRLTALCFMAAMAEAGDSKGGSQ